MFPMHRETTYVVNALLRQYPEVAVAIRTNVIQGRRASVGEEEGVGLGYVPYSLDEQLELCRSYITEFIETPCRAALNLHRLAGEYQETQNIVFAVGTAPFVPFNAPVEGAKEALDHFLDTIHAYIDSLKPRPSDDATPSMRR